MYLLCRTTVVLGFACIWTLSETALPHRPLECDTALVTRRRDSIEGSTMTCLKKEFPKLQSL